MDVTSMLNMSTASLGYNGHEISTSSPPSSTKNFRAKRSATAFRTPSPELEGQGHAQVFPIQTILPPNESNLAAKEMQDISPTATFPLRPATEASPHGNSHQIGPEFADTTGRVLTDSGEFQIKVIQPTLSSQYYQAHRSSESSEAMPEVTDILGPFGHKFSDSYSSLSSHGSHQSESHSRVSSVTTLAGSYSGDLALAEVPENESLTAYQGTSSCPPTTRDFFQPEKIDLARTHEKMEGWRRPGSPSEVALPMQGPTKPFRAETLPRLTPDAPFTLHSRSHKRAISAPDFSYAARQKHLPAPDQLHKILPPPREVMAISEEKLSPRMARADKTADTAYSNNVHSQARSLPFLQALQDGETWPEPQDAGCASSSARLPPVHRPSTATESSLDTLEQSAEGLSDGSKDDCRCMFVENCETGSQLRKAISHLFGRNKTCTLKIPKHVWVYYCRKHYQRVRYRNARSYPVNQMELVQMQLERLRAWSETNKQAGKGAYIKSWTLSLRKREEKRLMGNKAATDKDKGNKGAVGAGQSQGQGGGAVPEWLVVELGRGYDTARMFAIAARLRKEIEEGSLAQVPEIEFLPDIVDGDEGPSIRPNRLRRQNTGTGNGSSNKTPKRKALEFQSPFGQAPMQRTTAPLLTFSEMPIDAGRSVSPRGKRARMGREADSGDAYGANYSYTQRSAQYGAPNSSPVDYIRRAQTIVPKMRPLEYHYPVPFSTSYGEGYEHHPQYIGSQDNEVGTARLDASEYRQMAPDLANRYGNTTSAPAPRLPPIVTAPLVGGNGLGSNEARTAPPSARPRLGRPGMSRPLHQRSASAYTPMIRHMRMEARPSSSGNEGTTAIAQTAEAPRQHGYGYGHGHSDDPRVQQAFGRYAQAQGWMGAYGHGAAQNELHGPAYGHAPGHGSSAGTGSTLNYPEPRVPPAA